MPVAFAGEPGSFAEDAVLVAFPDAVATPVGAFADVVAAVADGSVPLGVLPIENVAFGTVREVLDLLLDADATIVGEVIVPVRLCLAALPGERLDGHRARLLAHPGARAGRGVPQARGRGPCSRRRTLRARGR